MALPKLTTPKYELNIPSTGKTINYRPYLVREEKILMIAMESEDDKQMTSAITDIIASCTFDEIDVTKLTMSDVEYIFAKLRAKSVGETTLVHLPCEKCEHMNEVTINLDKELNVTAPGETKIVITSDIIMVMKYPAMKDYLDLSNIEQSEVDKVFSLLSICIDSIVSGDEIFEASTHSRKELIEFLESLNQTQFKSVQAFIETMPHTFVKVAYTCKYCNHDHDIELKGLKNFFG